MNYFEILHQEIDHIQEHVEMAQFTTLKIGGPADLFFEAKTKKELIHVIQLARKNNIPHIVLGGGSNILISDKGIRGLVIKNSTRSILIRGMVGSRTKDGTSGLAYVEADSGAIMNSLVRFTIEEGLEGLEMHLGLPGTVGGAIYMNSKWTHPSAYVGDSVYQATIIDAKGEVITVPHSYFAFDYDSSRIQKTRDVVASVTFMLKKSSKEKLWDQATRSMNYRKETQPQGVRSPGCTFQNITHAQALAASTPNLTTSAGFLIDHAGLKGATVGGAQVSTQHANFIVNTGSATSEDVVNLIHMIQIKVKQKYGIELQEEIVYIGEF